MLFLGSPKIQKQERRSYQMSWGKKKCKEEKIEIELGMVEQLSQNERKISGILGKF